MTARCLYSAAVSASAGNSILLKLIRTNKPERTEHINEYYDGKVQVNHFAFEKLSPDLWGGWEGEKSFLLVTLATGSLLSDKTLKFSAAVYTKNAVAIRQGQDQFKGVKMAL